MYTIDILNSSSWIAEIECGVEYHGSAFGELKTGTYIVIKKQDGSINIQAGDKNLPRNYLRATKFEICYSKNHLICTNKKERLVIKVHKINWCNNIDLATHNVVISKSEKQLVDIFCDNIDKLLPEAYNGKVIREYQIPNSGRVDVGIFKEHETWLIEFKRKKATQTAVGQVLKYGDHYTESYKLNLILVAPDISDNGLKYAESNKIKFIKLSWD